MITNSQINRKHNNRKLAVEVAKDVLLQLKLKKIKLTPGTYLTAEIPSSALNTDLQTCLLKNKVKNCKVCGIGAAVISLIRLKNDFQITEENAPYVITYNYNEDIYVNNISKRCLSVGYCGVTNRLSQVFTQEQISDIENLFECFSDYYDFKANYNNPDDRIKIIMKNIIKNKGILDKWEVLDYTGKP